MAPPDSGPETKPAGLYIHIPFCLRKCPYCDFFSITDLSSATAFIDALISEMAVTGNGGFEFDTLYVGGGTPTVLPPQGIHRIVAAAHRTFTILPDAEITLEANPGTLTGEGLRIYRDSGANRINIGVQSFLDANLDFLGRIHTGKEAEVAIAAARHAGFRNVGIDLIYGLPGQTREAWLRDLRRAAEFEPEHLSCYMLTCEPGTPLDRRRLDGRFRPLPDDRVGDLFETARVFLAAHGYVQYEISNYARSTSEGFSPFTSRHNRKYWSHAPYIGLGPSAHSFDGRRRYWNIADVKQYIECVAGGRSAVAEKEELSREQRMMESVYLGCRQTSGISIEAFNRSFDADFKVMFGEALTILEEKGYVEFVQNRCSLTPRGMLFLDSIVTMLIT